MDSKTALKTVIEYIDIVFADQFGDDAITEDELAAACARATDWLTEHEGDDVLITMRSGRTGKHSEIAGLYRVDPRNGDLRTTRYDDEHSYTILLPISGESLGRWLEEHSATISIACMIGTYHVHINRHRLESNVEKGNLSVTRSSDIEVSAYDKTLEAALGAAMRKCSEEPHADG